MAGENVRDAGLSATDQMKRVMKVFTKKLDRFYKKINDRFSQLFDIVVVVVVDLPKLFLGMGARINSAESQ